MRTVTTFVGALLIAASAAAAEVSSNSNSVQAIPQTTNGNFVLYVSNQSFAISPVDITIHIDGKRAVSNEFHVRNQHNWIAHTFQLAPGKHILRAVSKKGDAVLEKEFKIKKKAWAVVDFWHYPKQSKKKHFSFNCQDKPVYFM